MKKIILAKKTEKIEILEWLGSEEVLKFDTFIDIIKHFEESQGELLIYMWDLDKCGKDILKEIIEKGYTIALNLEKITQLKPNQFTTHINSKNNIFSIAIKNKKNRFIIRDIKKILVNELSELKKDYNEEKSTDLQALKHIMIENIKNGNDEATIGASSLKELKKTMKYDYTSEFRENFPDLQGQNIENRNIDEWCRRAYFGGINYIKKGIERKYILGNGVILDINSLYPYSMHSMSDNYIPTGFAKKIKTIEEFKKIKEENKKFYIVEFKATLKLKNDDFAFLRIRNNAKYDRKKYIEECDNVNFVLSKIDFEEMEKRYDIYNFEYVFAVEFDCKSGMFDGFIQEKYNDKTNSKGAKRQISKLKLNSVYGKLASCTENVIKIPYVRDGDIYYNAIKGKKRTSNHIAAAIAISAFSRKYLLKNMDKVKEKLLYTDTDSLHLFEANDKEFEKMIGTEMGKFKVENKFKEALYIKQKCYILKNDDEIIIKIAGLDNIGKENLKKVIKKMGLKYLENNIVKIETGTGIYTI